MISDLYSKEIFRYLTGFTTQVKLENSAGQFGINKAAEGFLIPILNKIFKTEFERLEFTTVNAAAVDLRSKDGKIVVQVTSETRFEKIRDTIAGFVAHKLYEQSKLIHLVINDSYKTSKTDSEIQEIIQAEVDKLQLREKPKIEFSLADIWNIDTLRKQLEMNCDVAEQKAIRDFLHAEYGDIILPLLFAQPIIPYRVEFDAITNPDASKLAVHFDNPFFGREKELEVLTNFIASDTERVITVVADGGYGKTRLCIEFFKNVIDASGDKKAFVLNEKAFKGGLFAGDKEPDEMTIILVDDAHKKADILDNLLKVVKQHKNVKLILTVRKALYEDTVRSFSTHSRGIQKIVLARLSYDDTLSLIGTQVAGLNQGDKQRLAEQSKGVPIVVLGLCYMIASGKYSSEISEEENFIRFVREQRDQVIEDISAKHLLTGENINKTIQLLALLGPVRNDENEIRQLAALNSMSYEDCSIILTGLEEHEFIQQGAEISILTDPYSDVVLLDAAPRLKFILIAKGIERFIDRIIRNLVGVEHSSRLKLNVDTIVLDFISSMSKNKLASHEDIAELNENLETLRHFAYKKPSLALKAIHLILKITAGTTTFWQKDSSGLDFGRIGKTQDLIDRITAIIALNSHGDHALSEVFDVVVEMARRRSDFKPLQIAFRYREYDFEEYGYRPYAPCERHQFLANRLTQLVSSETLTEFDLELIYTGTTILLRLDFAIEEVFDKYKHTFSYGTAHVVDNETTKKIRDEAIAVLIALFAKARGKAIGDQIFDALLRMLHFTTKSTHRGDNPLNQSSQVEMVENFLLAHLSNSPSAEERAKLHRQLQMYMRRQVKPEYVELHKKLSTGAEDIKDSKQRIEVLLRSDYFFKLNNLEKVLKESIAAYKNWQDFYEDAVIIVRNFNGDPTYNELFNHVIAHHPDKAKEMYEFVRKTYPDLTVAFGELIRANYKDNEYFYGKIDELWKIDTQEARHMVVYLLTVGRNRDKKLYEGKDFPYIAAAIAEGNRQAIFRLSITLAGFMDLDYKTTLKLCEEFIDQSHVNDAEMLIASLFEDVEVTARYKDALKEFAFKKTVRLDIGSYYFNHIFEFLLRDFGFDTLFSFLVARIDFIEKEDAWHRFDMDGVPTGTSITSDQREDNFLKAIHWYATIDNPSEWTHKKIIEYFKPNEQFSPSLRMKLESLISACNGDVDRICRLCSGLAVYKEMNDEFLEFLISTANSLVELPGYTKERLDHVFGIDFKYNVGGTRSKSGSGAYPQDLERRDFLVEAIQKFKMEKDVKELFEFALREVEKSIQDEIAQDNNNGW